MVREYWVDVVIEISWVNSSRKARKERESAKWWGKKKREKKKELGGGFGELWMFLVFRKELKNMRCVT